MALFNNNSYIPMYQQQAQPQYMPNTNQQQTQFGGFISVRSEQEAKNYPIAPGVSLTFKDESTPYIYTKTMGFSQLEQPIFEKYRLVRETQKDTEQTFNNKVDNLSIENQKCDIKEIREVLQGLQKDIKKLKDFKAQFDDEKDREK